MLIQFRFQNFKSFRDDTILDFSATKITEHGDHVVTIGREKLLPVAAIFGANASGKSNVVEAFRFMRTYIGESFLYGGASRKEREDQADKENQSKPLTQPPFLFDSASQGTPSSFEVYFTDPEDDLERIYNYGFTLGPDGIVEEWLNIKSKTSKVAKKIFSRNGAEYDLAAIPKKLQENILLSLEKETLIVSLGAKLKIDILKTVFWWFAHIEIVDFGIPARSVRLSRQLPKNFEDKSVQNQMVSYLSAFDPSITGFHVEQKDNGRFLVYTLHRTRDGDFAVLPLSQESSGTLKMFALYPYLQDTLEHSRVLLIDELNARLHPLLVRSILLTFLDPNINKNHAQLIFTTHDAWQLSNDLLRRDEIWFTEKDEDGASTLYSLADFQDEDGDKIRKDENYEKNYLLGKYGAIPTLKCFDILGEG